MGVWTKIIVAIVVTCIPVSGAWAIGGKFERRACGQQDTASTEGTSGKTTGVSDASKTSGAGQTTQLDWTAVELLRNASADDLSDAQMQSFYREVARLRAREAKVKSDGTLSDADRDGLARAAYYSCQKIMTPQDVRRTAVSTGVWTGTDRESHR